MIEKLLIYQSTKEAESKLPDVFKDFDPLECGTVVIWVGRQCARYSTDDFMQLVTYWRACQLEDNYNISESRSKLINSAADNPSTLGNKT